MAGAIVLILAMVAGIFFNIPALSLMVSAGFRAICVCRDPLSKRVKNRTPRWVKNEIYIPRPR